MGRYFKTCEECGASLDPGERCDCAAEKENAASSDATLKAAQKKISTINIADSAEVVKTHGGGFQ